MSRRYDPSIGHQRSSTAELFRQEARFDQCRLPRVRTETGRVATHYPVSSGVQLATTCETEI